MVRGKRGILRKLKELPEDIEDEVRHSQLEMSFVHILTGCTKDIQPP